MGHRKFYDQFIQDVMKQKEHKITDEVDVTTLKDYMQYLSLLDETPSYMGGRDNSWRKLTLEVLPRHTVFYDVVGYLYSHKMTPQLKAELPTLLTQPTTEFLQLQHIKILSEVRLPDPPVYSPKIKTPNTKSSRRSHRAKARAQKMRNVYEMQKQGSDVDRLNQNSSFVKEGNDTNRGQGQVTKYMDEEEDDEEEDAEEEWEMEADKLYEWTQQLSFDEIVVTPRLATSLAASRLGSVLY